MCSSLVIVRSAGATLSLRAVMLIVMLMRRVWLRGRVVRLLGVTSLSTRRLVPITGGKRKVVEGLREGAKDV